MTTPRNPLLTFVIIIRVDDRIVLIKRKNPPHGRALPGGFVDYGESIEAVDDAAFFSCTLKNRLVYTKNFAEDETWR